ncbi:MAG: glucokinase [Hyphomicrobium sp.]|nr:MAG: hypothetical protein F9K20_16270 [Hyphomicrobium sp.]MBZ0209274.1 glucokinase [Hyphomicrobium sp.]
MRSLLSQENAGIGDALQAYTHDANGGVAPARALLAVAATPAGDKVSLTNNPWTFSIEELRERAGLRELRIVNDFYAHAAAVPHLGENERIRSEGQAPQFSTSNPHVRRRPPLGWFARCLQGPRPRLNGHQACSTSTSWRSRLTSCALQRLVPGASTAAEPAAMP